MSEPPEMPGIDPYVAFVLSLPDDQRRRLGRLLESLVTRDDGGWTIQNQTADQFLERHRDYLRSIIESDYHDDFHARD